MKNKNIIRIIYGTIVIIVLVLAMFMTKKQNNHAVKNWETYKNDEFNFEVKHPGNVEVEIGK